MHAAGTLSISFPYHMHTLKLTRIKKVCAWRLPSITTLHNFDTYMVEKGAKEDMTSWVASLPTHYPHVVAQFLPSKTAQDTHAEKERSI